MVKIWYGILAFMLTYYVVQDSRNFGAAILHLFVARTPAERRQVLTTVAPVYSWHEVWLVAFGGALFLAFPLIYATSFSSYYLALFLILWCFILRGVTLEVRSEFDDRMWWSFWDFVFVFSNVLLAILFGAALGNIIRGVPLDSSGHFAMAFFTDFGVRGNVGLLDWYTISVSVVCLLVATAHGANYLVVKTDGPVHFRSATIARWLWSVIPFLSAIILIETIYVRPGLFSGMMRNPVAWLGIVFFLAAAAMLYTGLRQHLDWRAFAGSGALIASILVTGAAAIFPVILYSTFGPENSLTAYNSAASIKSLRLALIWWPFALMFAWFYSRFIARHYSGRMKIMRDAQTS